MTKDRRLAKIRNSTTKNYQRKKYVDDGLLVTMYLFIVYVSGTEYSRRFCKIVKFTGASFAGYIVYIILF